MSLSRRIAWRYLRRPSDRLVSAVGLVSIFGLVIGVMALVISMALMTGYRDDLQKKLLGGNAEVFVYAVGGPISDTKAALQKVRTTPGVADAWPVLYQHAVVTTEKSTIGTEVMLKGVEPSRAKSAPMLAKVLGGRSNFATAEGESGVAVGKYLATRLGVTPGSSLSVTVPNDRGNGSFLPRSASFVVTNVYATGFYEYDARWIFVDLSDAERLLAAPGTANLLEVKLAPGANLDDDHSHLRSFLDQRVRDGVIRRAIDKWLKAGVMEEGVIAGIGRRTDHRYAVNDWRDINRQLFSMLRVQQIALFIIIGLIVFVSTFNIVSTLIMTVHEKRKEIGILASMGAEKKLVRRIFLWYGTMVGFAGTALGIVLGTAICWLITRYQLVSFGPEIAEVYFVSSIPFITRAGDLLVIAGFSLLVSFLATIIPSARAARLNPVEALRHE